MTDKKNQKSPLPDEEIGRLIGSTNVRGVRDCLGSTPLVQKDVDAFRDAFIATTRALFPHPHYFEEQARPKVASGACFESHVLRMNIEKHGGHTDEPESQHLSLPNEQSYRNIEDRPFTRGRTWFTREERKHAAMLSFACPLIPLTHITLLSMVQEEILDLLIEKQSSICKGDCISYVLRWLPTNTVKEVAPAISVGLLQELGVDGSDEDARMDQVQEIIGGRHEMELANQETMERVFQRAKKFLFDGKFFFNELTDGTSTVTVKCPGKEFMKNNWDLQFEIYREALKRMNEEPLNELLKTLAGHFQKSATER